LRVKLLVSFASVLLVSGILGVVSIVELSSLKRSGDVVALNALPSYQTILTIDSNEQSYRRNELMNLISTDSKTVAQIQAQMAQERKDITSAFAGYAKLVSNGQDHALWTSSQSQWNAFVTRTAPLAKPGASVKDPAMVALVMASRKPFLALATTSKKWSGLNFGIAGQEVHASQSAYSTGLMLVIVMLAIAVLLGAGIALGISASIRKSVGVVLDRMRSLQD
jgi:methyl-accepting chemotaxis protein